MLSAGSPQSRPRNLRDRGWETRPTYVAERSEVAGAAEGPLTQKASQPSPGGYCAVKSSKSTIKTQLARITLAG